MEELEAHLKEFSTFALVERAATGVDVHLHTDHPGKVIEQAIGWGPLKGIHVTNMSEPHTLAAHDAIMKVALLAVAENKVQAKELQEQGVQIIATGSEMESPSVAELVNAAHSDLAYAYVMVAWNRDFWQAFRQVKRLLGERIELVLCETKQQQAAAIHAFDPNLTAVENAIVMREAAEEAK
jgi:dihydroxyacetone kinase-like predicted kinase